MGFKVQFSFVINWLIGPGKKKNHFESLKNLDKILEEEIFQFTMKWKCYGTKESKVLLGTCYEEYGKASSEALAFFFHSFLHCSREENWVATRNLCCYCCCCLFFLGGGFLLILHSFVVLQVLEKHLCKSWFGNQSSGFVLWSRCGSRAEEWGARGREGDGGRKEGRNKGRKEGDGRSVQ